MEDHLIGRAIEQVREQLQEKGYRLTPQRSLILETLLRESERHLSADDLYSILKRKVPELGLATVYRTLELFRELGVVHQMDFAEGMSRYEYGDREHHHHLVCLNCGQIVEFSSKELEALESALADKYDFEVVGHHMKMYGYCQECRSKKKI